MRDKVIAAVRSGLQLLPFGIGGAIDQGYFGTADEKRLRRIEAFLEELSKDLASFDHKLAKRNPKTFSSDQFTYLFEGVLRRVTSEVQRERVAALRGVLVSIILEPEALTFEKQSHFLQTVDAIGPAHIHVLRLLAPRFELADKQRFLTIQEIWNLLGAQKEADRNFIYSAFDTLANREFVQSGPVPWDKEGRIDKPRQEFRITALGLEFLAFIRQSI